MLPEAARPEYVSAWCPLDDATKENGTLVLLPFNATLCEHTAGTGTDAGASKACDWCGPGASKAVEALLQQQHRDGAQALERRAKHALVVAEVDAGDIVLFSSRLWHCSHINKSSSARRVLYAQYSNGVVAAGPSSSAPLCMAIKAEQTTEKVLN